MIFIVFERLNLSISCISSLLKHGDVALDCTLGNGHDAMLLANLVGDSGQVHGFDVQEQALANSRNLLAGKANVFLYLAGHEKLGQCLPKALQGRVRVAMFNLGYLPGSSKSYRVSYSKNPRFQYDIFTDKLLRISRSIIFFMVLQNNLSDIIKKP